MLARRYAPIALLLAALCAASTGRAADVRKDTSLPLIPADAAFYTSSLRLKEQIDLFYNSKAYKALREVPSIKKLYAEAMSKAKEKGGPLDALEGFMKNKDNKDLVEVLTEAVSDEVFLLGGKSWVTFFGLFQVYSNAASVGMLEEILAGTDPARAQPRSFLNAFLKNKDLIQVPDLVVGFRLKTPAKAEAQLARLEKILGGLEAVFEPLKDRVKSKKTKDGKFVTVEFDGGQLPWDNADLSDFERNKGEFDPLIAHLKKLKLTITLGVRGEYLLLSIGEKSSEAERLGGDAKKLMDRPEMKPIIDVADKKFVSVGYTSQGLLEAYYGAKTDYIAMAKKLKESLNNSALPDARKKAYSADIDELASDLKDVGYKPGAQAGYVLLTDYGFEQMGYDYGSHAKLAKVKLGLVPHLGGSPLFAAAGGFTVDGGYFATAVKWAKKGYGHAESFFLDFVDNDMADKYKTAMKNILPRLQKLEDITTKTLIPAMKQGGLGVVIDAKWKSNAWIKELKLGRDMPLPELGVLVGLSDAAKFTEAMKGYRLAFNDLYAAIRESSPDKDNIPEFSIPEPKTEKADGGSLYWWELPDVGFDRQLQPTAGVGKNALVLGLSKAHAARMMKPTPLKFRDPALSFKGDVVAVSLLDWVGVVDTVSPWVENIVGAVTIVPADDEEAKKKAKIEAARVAKEINTALSIFKAFKGYTAVARVEGGVLVTRTAIVIRDIDGVVEP